MPPNEDPPNRRPFFETVRRYSDMQFSTLLHNLIGLPSSVSPPSNKSDWILDSDIPASDPSNPRPRTVRSGSDSIVEEVRKLQDDDGKDGGAGLGLQRTVSNIMPKTETKEAKRVLQDGGWEWRAPLGVVKAFEEAHREFFLSTQRSFARDTRPPLLSSLSESNAGGTELDYYAFFERESNRPRVVAAFEEVRSITGVDGVTNTRRVEVRKFSDGKEERVEKVNTRLPPRIDE